MNRRLVVSLIGGAALVAVTGVVIVAADEPKGAAFIPGDQPVTEDLVRQKLQSAGYSNIQAVRQGLFFGAMGSNDGTTGKFRVDALTGQLAGDDNDDD